MSCAGGVWEFRGEPFLAFPSAAWKMQFLDGVIFFLFLNVFQFVAWTEWVSSSCAVFLSETSAGGFGQLLV